MNNSTRLFGKKTKHDWLTIRAVIIINPNDKKVWSDATNLLNERLETRYFKPIERILKMQITTGEGFAAITLICSLLEFLQSCYEGKVYQYGASETKFIYGSSAKKFKSFLETHEPFKSVFNKTLSRPSKKNKTFADDFYSGVRCGLLHEAATNNGWFVRTSPKTGSQNTFVDLSNENEKIIYRDKFFEAIKTFSSDYQKQIIQNLKDQNSQFLRDNFCRKLDSICIITDRTANWWKP